MASQLIDHDLRCPAKKQEKAPECLNQDGRGETTVLQNNSGNFGSLGNDRNYKALEVPGISIPLFTKKIENLRPSNR